MFFPCGKRSLSLEPPLPLRSPGRSPSDANTLIVKAQGRPTAISVSGDSLVVQRVADKRWPRVETTIHHVLWAELKGCVFELSFLARRKRTSPLSSVRISGGVRIDELDHAAAFAARLMDQAYAGIKRHKKLKVLVNPKSGQGNGITYYNECIEPIFHAACCIVDSTFTSYCGHARELMGELDLDQYDAVVVASGDGLVHEVINGFADHSDPERAFRIPIAPVPCGSGNGLSLNLLGLQDGADVAVAVLNAIKGRPMHIDLMSVTQSGRTTYSFMSQCVGLFADLDLGTEYMRFLGAQRFVIGYLIGIVQKRTCPVRMSMKDCEWDKRKMAKDINTYLSKMKALDSNESPVSADYSQPLLSASTGYASVTNGTFVDSTTRLQTKNSPPLSAPDSDGWVSFTRPLLYVYGGKGPFVSRDLMNFPVSIADDGLIDISAQEITTRKEMIDAMDGANRGAQYWMDPIHYFRARAYRVEPYSSKGCFSLDGERYPFESFEVECHRAMATVLSPCGYYNAEFHLPEERQK